MPDVLQARLTLAPDALFQDIAGETVILFRDRYFSLTAVGARVWTGLAEGRGLDAIVAAILAEYEVDEATLRTDVAGLLDQMIAEGLVIKA